MAKRIKCRICGRSFADIGGLSKHRSKSHPSSVARSRAKAKARTKRTAKSSGRKPVPRGGGMAAVGRTARIPISGRGGSFIVTVTPR